jgi:coenzyme F420-reducing hydrogenase delta subunit
MAKKVVAFCCDECGYATVDMAGMAGIDYPPNILTIRIPCLGWVSPYHIFKAYEKGADGVLLVGCMSGNCHNVRGNNYAEKVVLFVKDILDEIGLSRQRLEMTHVCAANPLDFSEAASVLLTQITALGSVVNRRQFGEQAVSYEDDASKVERG